jgi:hypothetical protein
MSEILDMSKRNTSLKWLLVSKCALKLSKRVSLGSPSLNEI